MRFIHTYVCLYKCIYFKTHKNICGICGLTCTSPLLLNKNKPLKIIIIMMRWENSNMEWKEFILMDGMAYDELTHAHMDKTQLMRHNNVSTHTNPMLSFIKRWTALSVFDTFIVPHIPRSHLPTNHPSQFHCVSLPIAFSASLSTPYFIVVLKTKYVCVSACLSQDYRWWHVGFWSSVRTPSHNFLWFLSSHSTLLDDLFVNNSKQNKCI